jgi:tripeptide aminopeptidase
MKTLTLSLLFVLAVSAQTGLENHPQLKASLAAIQKNNSWTLEQQASICEIPAPPFNETERGKEYAKRLAALGMVEIRTDKVGNVISKYPGSSAPKPLIIFSAHLDTVFPAGMDVKVKKDGNRLTGLGIGDDCRGLAVVLATGKADGKQGQIQGYSALCRHCRGRRPG